MPSLCFVPNCPTGSRRTRRGNRDNNLPNPALFGTPLDHDTFQAWKRRIPRADRKLTSIDKICELHFEKDCILRQEEFTLPNGRVVLLERKRPALKFGSIPTKFPNCPSYMTTTTKKRKSPALRKLVSPSSEPSRPSSNGKTTEVKPVPFEEPEDKTCNRPTITINELYDRVSSLLGKECSCTLLNNNLVIQKWTPSFQCHYRIIVMESLGIKVFLKGKGIVVKMDDKTYERIESIDELLRIIRHVTAIPICNIDAVESCEGFIRPEDIFCRSCLLAL